MPLTDAEKTALRNRLRRAEGQVAAVGRMIEGDEYCVNVLTQLRAAAAALDRVGQVVLESHLRHCVSDAIRSGDGAAVDEKVAELMTVFARYGGK